jgi:hypothetical protein
VPQAGVRRFTFFRKSVTDPPGAGIRQPRIATGKYPGSLPCRVLVSMFARDEKSALREKLAAIVYLSSSGMRICKPGGRFLHYSENISTPLQGLVTYDCRRRTPALATSPTDFRITHRWTGRYSYAGMTYRKTIATTKIESTSQKSTPRVIVVTCWSSSLCFTCSSFSRVSCRP